ncbi:hypothetical protein [Streptomyces asiaticus]
MSHIEINGSPATADTLRLPALTSYGHFTAMQIRDARVRGLDLHLERLRSATRELFGGDLADLASYRSAFLTNSQGLAPVRRIDEVEYAVDAELMRRVGAAYDAVEWDAI